MASYGDWQDVLNEADIDTARLIVQLQLQDSYELARTFDGVPDAVLAERLHREELNRLQAEFPGRQCGEDLEEEYNEHEEALEGAAFGWRLNEWDDRVERVPDPPQFATCVACTDRVHPDKILKVPCGHDYCNDCLEQLYYRCMTDETLFPPRCCHKEFPYEHVKHHLSQRCKSIFGQKRVELETKDRTYCHVPTCSAFIKPSDYELYDDAKCGRCGALTCPDCKGPFHRSRRCPRDETMDALMQTAEKNEWQRCFGCRRVIELKTGCNHITCVCKSQFCYQCGVEWKNCNCDQWDEDRLVERAEAAVDLEPGPRHENRAQREARVERAVEHLRDNHNCEHERFQSIGRRGMEYHCELCGEEFYHWIYQCRQCLMIACNTCRHNRL